MYEIINTKEGKKAVKPEIHRPFYESDKWPKGEYAWRIKEFNKEVENYKKHLLTLPTIDLHESLLHLPLGPVEGREQWQVLEPVPPEGELEWVTSTKEEYDKYKDCQDGTVTRIVLMPEPKWRRYRFETKNVDDYRPLIFNPEYPWWCSGHGINNEFECSTSVIITYLPIGEDLTKYWDDAFNIEHTDHATIEFSGRFPKPEYFKN